MCQLFEKKDEQKRLPENIDFTPRLCFLLASESPISLQAF
jgi:hypothetical protein